jgi:DNA repair protein RecO (recombination protein O)
MEKSAAILLRKTLLTDTSLIVHWCTREHGLIRTAAKGARRPGSPFAGKLDLFYSAGITWARSRRSDLHALREAAVIHYRQGIQQSWLRVLAASYFTALIECVAEPDTPVPALHDLLVRALDWLHSSDPTRRAVLFFEKEVAADLGIHGDAGISPIAAIGRVYHRLPAQRERLLSALSGGGASQDAGKVTR